MSHTTLSSIAIDVVGEYAQTGKNLVRAYRGGSERLVRGFYERSARLAAAEPLRVIGAENQARLVGAQEKVAEFVVRGIGSASDGADGAIDRLAQGATAGIQRVSEAGDRLEARIEGVFPLATALPRTAAQASLQIAGKVSELSQRLSDRIVGAEDEPAAPARKATRKVAAKKTVRRTRKAAATA